MPTNLDDDVYVSAVEVRPGNPRIVHHALLFIDPFRQGRKLEQAAQLREKDNLGPDVGAGYSTSMGVGFSPRGGGLSGWAPGQVPRHLPDGTAFLLPKGADVVMQVHYHRVGRVERDRTTVGLYFAKKPVQRRVQGVVVAGGQAGVGFFLIPPGKDGFVVKGSTWVEDDCEIYSVLPHMHLLGKKIKVTLTPPGGPTQTLVAIDDWDYNWQETYFFEKPIKVKAESRLDIEAVYDNSAGNPNNPNSPPRLVMFGQQTTDEMCFGFIGATSDKPGRIKQRRTEQPRNAGRGRNRPARDG
jgi:hypothetical protein